MLQTPMGSEAVWADLRELAARSKRAPVLEPALKLAERLPAADRRVLAMALATCAAPLEWPLEAEALRPALTAALGDLLGQLDPKQPGSLAWTLQLGLEDEALAAGL